MSYLIQADYKKSIQTDNLLQVVGSDSSVLPSAELAAQEEVQSYLIQKYDLSQEFTDTKTWKDSVAYKALDRVVDDNGQIYFATLPQPLFDYTQIYKIGDQVFWKNKVYTALMPSRNIGHDLSIQYPSYKDIPIQNVFPDDPTLGAQHWGAGTAYSVTAGTVLTDTTKWTKADNRSQQMVMMMVDITLYHLHSRISPRNVPDVRVKRYDEAVNWLKAAGQGKITANLPVKQVHSGSRIRFGGNPKMINRY
jgi:hypothetical protein